MAGISDIEPRRDRSASLFSTDSYSHHRQWRRPAHTPDQPWTAPESTGTRGGDRDVPNRRSFFGRALSDAAVRTRVPTLHSTMSSQSPPPHQHPPRPETSLSSTRRSKTEPLQQIRDSLFGGRKKVTPPISREALPSQEPRPSSRSDHVGRGDVLLAQDQFRSELDYYRYLRKNTISPPFNFEHVTHTAKQQLPPLETVHEKDLPARFWSVSAYQRPKRQLNGIKADDLSKKLPAMGVERGAPSSRPTSPVPVELDVDRPWLASSMGGPVSGIDETMFDEARDTIVNPTHDMRQFDKLRKPLGHPHRKSSLTTLNDQRLKYLSQLPAADPAMSLAISTEREDVEQDDRHVQRGRKPTNSLRDVAEESERASSRRPASVIDRSRQPLPPVPNQQNMARRSRSSLRPSIPATASVPSFTPSEIVSPARTRRSSQRSSCSTFQSPTISKPFRGSNPTLTSLLSDATWEDDVEFCYQHEAESTCDFDWQDTKTLREPSIAESEGGVRLSAWIAPSPSPTPERSRSARRDSCESPAPDSRRSVVGHRGFLAARTNSLLSHKKSLAPPNIHLAPLQSSHANSMLSPVISIAGSDTEAPASASLPAFSPQTLHFRNFDSVQRRSTDNLSDPESNSTLSSRNRTSSSCSSYDSASRRTAPATTRSSSAAAGAAAGTTSAATATRETVRWSAASSISMPELLHSERRSKLALQKSSISRPLESLPHSPGASIIPGAVAVDEQKQQRQQIFFPRAPPAHEQVLLPQRQSLNGVVWTAGARQQSPGERAAMQRSCTGGWGGGRSSGVLQPRGRAAKTTTTPGRFSRLLAVEEGGQMVGGRTTTAAEWI